MNEKQDINEEVLTFNFTINQVNAILNVLGQAPFVASANLVTAIQNQGAPQFEKIKAEYDALPKDAEIIEETPKSE